MSLDNKSCYILLVCLTTVWAVTVKTKDGKVEGYKRDLPNGDSIVSFFGIPYAAPPLGENRYRPPQPVKPWYHTLHARTMKDGCVQAVSEKEKNTIWFVSNLPESEDCLYLNVWTPDVDPSKPLAVMIWFYSGGFFSGSSSMSLYDGGILSATSNVVVVSLNYRLTQFGFLFLNSSDVLGNAGIRDQIQAIRWVRDNIKRFGGDPERITLFGQCAGAISCGFHLRNKNIQDLYSKAIIQSGPISLTGMTISESQALFNSLWLAQSVNCRKRTRQETLICLQEKTVDELMVNYRGIPDYLIPPFVPCKNGREVPFSLSTELTGIPGDKRKNVLGGTIPREASFMFPYYFPGKKFDEHMRISEKDMKLFLLVTFQMRDKNLQNLVLHEYKEFCCNYNPKQIRVEASDIITDSGFICPEIDFMNSWISEYNKVFYYNFVHRPSVSGKEPIPEWANATHGNEIPFVFGAPLDSDNGYTRKEKKLSEEVMKRWTNFAKFGDPNFGKKVHEKWPEMEMGKPLNYLEIDVNSITAKICYKEKECEFWTKIFPGLLKNQGGE